MTYIKILGSGQEIGRSAIMVESRKKIVMDYGTKIEPEPPTYPMKEKVDAAVVCHAHLDHVGGAPLLAKGDIPIYMNDVTLELGTMLLNDSMKVAKKEGFGIPFDKHGVKRFVKNTKIVRYNEKFRVGEFTCTLWDSGHIPGSASVLVEENNKRIFYTSDIQTRQSHLLNPCKLPNKVDTLIIESTYGMRVQEERAKEEHRLREIVDETVSNGGIALIPVLAVGRSQEVMLILQDHAKKMALDGMARIASEIVGEYSSYIRNPKSFKELIKHVKFMRTDKDRETAIKKYPIIVATAGMLSGGPAVRYLREIQEHKHSSIIFTSFLAEDSPGYALTQTGIFENEEERFDVHGALHQIELSAHADRNGLLDIVKRTKPETVICVHGEQCKEFAKDIEEQFGVQTFAPKNGETIRV